VPQENAYNRSLLEASLDPLVTIGHDGKITDVNAATETVTGRTRAALIGTDFLTTSRTRRRRVPVTSKSSAKV
jgi:PAS domain S-box-containing protein